MLNNAKSDWPASSRSVSHKTSEATIGAVWLGAKVDTFTRLLSFIYNLELVSFNDSEHEAGV